MGATQVLQADGATGAAALLQQYLDAAGAPPDVIFECVGVPGVIAGVAAGTPAGSQIVVVGVCMETDRFEPAVAISKELEFRFVLGYSAEEFAATLRNIAEGRIRAAEIVTGRVGLDGVAGAFATLGQPGDQAKILVEPNRA